jgi:hypothetical protein
MMRLSEIYWWIIRSKILLKDNDTVKIQFRG